MSQSLFGSLDYSIHDTTSVIDSASDVVLSFSFFLLLPLPLQGAALSGHFAVCASIDAIS